MEYTSRKQRKELKKNAEEQETQEIKVADEEIFKEQKKRLRRQLNSVTTFSIDANDMAVTPNSLKTRTEVKKQKKIDEILRDIAVLPENEYLNEDTNLRLLKKMSVAKKYNNLQLSPEQEEKMAENKEKFETITNQLWFLISELEKGKVREPEIGTIPTMVSADVVKNRDIFDVEQAKTLEHKFEQTQADFEMTNMNTKIDLLEEKLEKISLKNDELEGVLQDLEKVVQEGKSIVNDEVEQQAYDIGEAPEDTLELLEYLEKLEDLNRTKALQLEANRKAIEAENTQTLTTKQNTAVTEKETVAVFEKQEKNISHTVNISETSKEDQAKNGTEVKPKKTEDSVTKAEQTVAKPEQSQEVKTTDTNEKNIEQGKTKPVVTDTTTKTETIDKVKPIETKETKNIRNSIIVLSIIFVILLLVLIFVVYNFWVANH